MSSSHEDHYLQEQKPIAFTIPFILASVLILIIFLFVSLCDPKPHHGHGEGHQSSMAPMEATTHNEAAMETVKAAGTNEEASKVENGAPAEQAHH